MEQREEAAVRGGVSVAGVVVIVGQGEETKGGWVVGKAEPLPEVVGGEGGVPGGGDAGGRGE